MDTHSVAPKPGSWTIDGHSSALRVSAAIGTHGTVQGRFHRLSGTVELGCEPADSTVMVEVDTDSLSSGQPLLDRLLRWSGIVDTARNPWIRFSSAAVRPHRTAGSWSLDGTLSTPSGSRETTLRLLAPVALGAARAGFRALGELPPRHAEELLGVCRGLLRGPLGLAMAVEAVPVRSPAP